MLSVWLQVQDSAERYAALVEQSDALAQLLQASRAGLRHLVLTYQDLQAWMENMEGRLAKYRLLAVHTDKLLQQMEDLAVSSHDTIISFRYLKLIVWSTLWVYRLMKWSSVIAWEFLYWLLRDFNIVLGNGGFEYVSVMSVGTDCLVHGLWLSKLVTLWSIQYFSNIQSLYNIIKSIK